MTITALIDVPAAASTEWHELLTGIGQIGLEPAIRSAFAHAIGAGVTAKSFCGVQFDAPNRPGTGPLVFFGVPHGPYRIFGAEGERSPRLDSGRTANPQP